MLHGLRGLFVLEELESIGSIVESIAIVWAIRKATISRCSLGVSWWSIRDCEVTIVELDILMVRRSPGCIFWLVTVQLESH